MNKDNPSNIIFCRRDDIMKDKKIKDSLLRYNK